MPWQRRMARNGVYGVYYIFKSMEQGPTSANSGLDTSADPTTAITRGSARAMSLPRACRCRRRSPVGVAGDDSDLFGCDADLVGDQLRQGRLPPLAMRRAADPSFEKAGGVHRQFDPLEARVDHHAQRPQRRECQGRCARQIPTPQGRGEIVDCAV